MTAKQDGLMYLQLTGSAPLAGPELRDSWPSVWQVFKAARDNTLTIFPKRAYRELVLGRTMPGRVVLIVSDPDGIGHVLVRNADNYVKGSPQLKLLKPATGEGLLTAGGSQWRRQRRIAAPVFRHSRLLEFAEDIAAETDRLSVEWDRVFHDDGGEVRPPRIDASAEMMSLTLRIICRTMFSADETHEAKRMGEALDLYFETAGRPNLHVFFQLPDWIPNPAAWRARPAVAYLQDLVRDLVRVRRRTSEKGNDLLGLLIGAQDEETGKSLSDQEIEDNLITFILAGHETTANALTWAFYLLSVYPDIADRVADEARRVFATKSPQEAVSSLIYTRMVVEEAMRLYPPVPMIERVALEADEIAGYPVDRGTVIFLPPWVIHRHEKLWYRPTHFDPERFHPDYATARHRHQFLPFGAGPRICIGMGFAMNEAVLILAKLVQRFRLTVDPAHFVEPVGRITLRPRGGLPVYLERRGRFTGRA